MTWYNPLTWWAKEPAPIYPETASQSVSRKYHFYRAAMVAGDFVTATEAQAFLEKHGYPVPTSIAEADHWLSVYGY